MRFIFMRLRPNNARTEAIRIMHKAKGDRKYQYVILCEVNQAQFSGTLYECFYFHPTFRRAVTPAICRCQSRVHETRTFLSPFAYVLCGAPFPEGFVGGYFNAKYYNCSNVNSNLFSPGSSPLFSPLPRPTYRSGSTDGWNS